MLFVVKGSITKLFFHTFLNSVIYEPFLIQNLLHIYSIDGFESMGCSYTSHPHFPTICTACINKTITTSPVYLQAQYMISLILPDCLSFSFIAIQIGKRSGKQPIPLLFSYLQLQNMGMLLIGTDLHIKGLLISESDKTTIGPSIHLNIIANFHHYHQSVV